MAASAFTLLHGEAPPKGWGKGEGGSTGRRWRLRRYWDVETWTAVFDGLLLLGGDEEASLTTVQVVGRGRRIGEGFIHP